ncbi:hypothetical protein MSMAW_3274 [Methanosarcina mazei WWM610]|nr:hypothetical protein MSMAW_3274 [Methanosarcina mazei WWM610]AKB63191.1 hypothetical protein MSMAP_3206 [Methanosarcina mazei SarPi]AKB66538.1 hypothetical protein MSMAS_3342 [Methanosarcina mazei S-6]AKB69885.1 hypothetical protein MSMAL_3342 [Methanosarcina mazei LYC]AKB73256.1 hypothetical protein MSMAC_3366 [Methanosarcina mazei C16]UWJ24722.1 hypothetical protein MSMAT_3466 [Methanosarcina mazei TMA]WIM44543.1 hypothetical protein PSF70_07030 [Methanosarcina mazei]
MGLTKATWIWLHNRAGILIIILVIIHLILHWNWIVRTTRNFFGKEKGELEENEDKKIEDKIEKY